MEKWIDQLAEQRKKEILESKSQYTATGTIYYMAPDGDDNAAGTAPECAWKSIAKLNATEFNAGDVVLFQRGGEWRGGLLGRSGVTYSAYGEGDKPILTVSRKNFAVEEEWIETEVANVYRYAEPIPNDVGLVVFNHGEAWSRKRVKGLPDFTGTIEEMDGDLDLYHDVWSQIVYLRSDKGNPGKRFSSIEMGEKEHIILVKGENVTVDNLCLRYGGAHGVCGLDLKGLTVRNCVLAWIGGSLQGVDPQAKSSSTTRYGNAVEIYVSCKDYMVENCWIYQIYDAGVTHQFKNYDPKTVTLEDIRYENNLIERCTYSIEYFLDQYDAPEQMMRNVVARGNICRFAGYGWGNQRPDAGGTAHVRCGTHPNPSRNFVFEGNIFDRSTHRIIEACVEDEASLPLYRGNLFVQNRGGVFGRYGTYEAPHRLFDASAMEDPTFAGNAFAISDEPVE